MERVGYGFGVPCPKTELAGKGVPLDNMKLLNKEAKTRYPEMPEFGSVSNTDTFSPASTCASDPYKPKTARKRQP